MIQYPSLSVSGLVAGVYVCVLVTTPALIALAVRGRSVFSYFIWTIVSRLDYIRHVEVVLNIQCFRREEPEIAFSFRQHQAMFGSSTNNI